MDGWSYPLLVCAGFAGGFVNAIAGGATLLTFPAMLAAGLPPIEANASNALAVAPGHLFAAIAERRVLAWRSPVLLTMLAGACLGGAIGALLLAATPPARFSVLVPALIGAATLLFACAPGLARLRRGAGRAPSDGVWSAGGVGLVAVYGGYFGAGLGVMLLAVLEMSGRGDFRHTNAVKNVLATAACAASILPLLAADLVRWPETATMLCGTLGGGLVGARVAARVPAQRVRRAVVTFGAALTLAYAWRYWS